MLGGTINGLFLGSGRSFVKMPSCIFSLNANHATEAAVLTTRSNVWGVCAAQYGELVSVAAAMLNSFDCGKGAEPTVLGVRCWHPQVLHRR